MKLLFASTEAYLPEFYGGVERSLDALAMALKRQGVEVALHTGVAYRKPGRWRWIGDALWRRAMGPDRVPPAGRFHGYPVRRSLLPDRTLPDHVRRFRPDHVILAGGNRAALAATLRGADVRIATYICDLSLVGSRDGFAPFDDGVLIANSLYTARHIMKLTGRESLVLPPSLDWRDYDVIRSAAETVLFVNPRREKGLDIVLAAARALPDIPFLILEGWALGHDAKTALERAVSDLPNVRLMSNRDDMRQVYAQAKILLVPTGASPDAPLIETWGRVATEAQASGIPVIATDDGGLPEAVGDGGILIPPGARVEEWVDALRHLWSSDALWRDLSEKALRHSRGDILDPDRHARLLIEFLASPKP